MPTEFQSGDNRFREVVGSQESEQLNRMFETKLRRYSVLGSERFRDIRDTGICLGMAVAGLILGHLTKSYAIGSMVAVISLGGGACFMLSSLIKDSRSIENELQILGMEIGDRLNCRVDEPDTNGIYRMAWFRNEDKSYSFDWEIIDSNTHKLQ